MTSPTLGLYGTLSLGGLIRSLERRPKDEAVRFDFGYFVPDGLASYRGFYDHLALGYSAEIREVNVGDLLAQLRKARGQSFDGYKGGSFTMRDDSPVWVANYSEAPSTAIVGIADCDYQTILKTEWVPV